VLIPHKHLLRLNIFGILQITIPIKFKNNIINCTLIKTTRTEIQILTCNEILKYIIKKSKEFKFKLNHKIFVCFLVFPVTPFEVIVILIFDNSYQQK